MDLLDRTKEICKFYNIQPSRSKGQNFLIAEDVYERIIAASDLKKNDIVLEVGPGLGFLTAKLAVKAGLVMAIELDDKLAGYLREKISTDKIGNVKIFNENVLDLDLENTKYEIRNTKYKIVANLPYNITSVFIRKFLTAVHKPEKMILMLQKEVAERICAKPGEMSLLALSVQFFSEPEIVSYVPKENFWPMPKVDSAIIRITCHSRESGNPVKSANGDVSGSRVKPGMTDEKEFFRLAKIGFSAKRKMLKNNLAGGLHTTPAEVEKTLIKIGLNPKARAEELAIGDWKNLTFEFK
jgi:16S rRNA (adenine1518-N6/adenine1519-N6)-dimethyltransferase